MNHSNVIRYHVCYHNGRRFFREKTMEEPWPRSTPFGWLVRNVDCTSLFSVEKPFIGESSSTLTDMPNFSPPSPAIWDWSSEELWNPWLWDIGSHDRWTTGKGNPLLFSSTAGMSPEADDGGPAIARTFVKTIPSKVNSLYMNQKDFLF